MSPSMLPGPRLDASVSERDIKSSLLFEKSPDPVLLLDRDVFIDCNEAALVCLGYSSKHQLIGMRPWDLSPVRQPDGRLSLHKGREIIEAALLKGTYRFEWLHRTFNGEELLMDVFLTLVLIGGRQILYTVWRDITARRKIEDALRISELRLSEAMDLARMVHWEIDPETENFLLNDRFYALYGTTAEREGGYVMPTEAYIERFVHPEDMERVRVESAQHRSDKGKEFLNQFEYRIIRRDGQVCHILTRLRVVRNEMGRMSRCFGTNQDITEHKETEKTLKESEERYRTAIEHSNDGVAIVRGSRHVFVSRRFLTMFGYDDPKEVVGAGLYVTIHPEDYERVMELNRTSKKGEPAPMRYEFKGVRRDGTVIYIEVSSTQIIYQGEPAKLAYLRDITERVRSEELLRESQKMEAIGTLSAGIAHDFNNVLTAILGFAELSYDETAAGAKAKRYLLHVVNAAHRGKDLVAQILSFSRKGKREFQTISLAPVVRESIRMLRASLPATIQIQEVISTETSTVFADPTQIQQIVMNLGTNAAHAMRNDGGQMKIELSPIMVTSKVFLPDLLPGAYMKLSITDTGTGMEEDVLERIFDPFFTTKKRGEGTGLGLWVVHSIVKNHKGTIAMKSAPGQGSAFDVYLPRIEKHRHRPVIRASSALEGHGHILIVDDETELAQLEKIMVEQLGYSATAVNDSRKALELFKDNPDAYDVVLTDQTMPGMTGIDLAREMMSIRSNIPVALITGYHDVVDEKAAREAGIRMTLPKPIARVDLGAAIKQVLMKH